MTSTITCERQHRGTGATVRSALLKLTAALIVSALFPAVAQTLPQLEYRHDDAKQAVKQTAKAARRALDDYQDALESQANAKDDLQDLKADRARLQAKAAKNGPADRYADNLRKLDERIALAEAKCELKARHAQILKEHADAIKALADQAAAAQADTAKKLADAASANPELAANKAVEDAKTARRNAERQLDDAADAAKDIAKKLVKATDRLQDLEDDLKDAVVPVATLKAKLNKADNPQDKADLEADLKKAEAKLQDLTAKRDTVKNALAEIAKANADAQKAAANAQNDYQNANQKLADAQKALADLQQRLKDEKAAAKKEAPAFLAAAEKARQEKIDKLTAATKAKLTAADQAAADQTAKRLVAKTTKPEAKPEPKPAPAAKPELKPALAAKPELKPEAKPAPLAEPTKTTTATAEPAPQPPVTMAWIPAAERELPALQGGQRLTVPDASPAHIADEAAVLPQFDVAMVSGDKTVVENLPIWKDWAAFIVFNKVTAKQVNEFHGQLLKVLREEGYVFAQVTFPTRIWSTGIFLAKVDLGVLGDITVRNQKHYSATQIAKALRNDEGRFNYTKIHSDLFDLNVKPDLKLNTQLSTAMINGRRVINADIEVDDSLPIHGAIEINNSASKSSDSDWRIRTTLQHLNITKNNDSLTIDYLTGGDVADDLNSFSASYFLPIDDKNHFSAFAGWNSSNADDILPEISVRGRGFFGGFAWTHTLYENVKERIELSLGWYYQKYESYQDLVGTRFDNGDYTVSMPTVTLGYSSKVYDKYYGRNFASITLRQSLAGKFGASSRSDFIATDGSESTDGDFLIAQLQVARFQRLFAGADQPGRWTLYAKGSVQLADDKVPTILRDYLGGMNSVRGYEESEIGGDNSIVGSIELRTPLLENFIPGLKSDDPQFYEKYPQHWSQHRLQFVAFTDFGYVSEKKREVADDDQELWSVGAGIRLGLTKYAQMSLDYGYPIIEASDDTPSSGRLHVSLQMQF
ncbi:MAG: ShlB/FhaC/HecB family hemolysin secretion/activation protein [Oligosphaeraceae bacterium]